MKPTIKDIAAKAKVSINTVSRALNDKDDVRKETRDRILAIADELGYVPNLLAKGLLGRRSLTIGVIVTDNANPFYAQILKGMEDYAREAGYSIVFCNSDEDPDRELSAIQTLRARRVDGILITPASTSGPFLAALTASDLPFVLLNRSASDGTVDCVKCDNIEGGRLAVARLLELGRRRLYFLGGLRRISSAAERAEGCRKAVAEAGLPPSTAVVVESGLHMEDGYHTMNRILRSGAQPDGVFAYSDIVAIGAMRAIREFGLRVPQDIAIVGYDDIEMASYLEVPLTTVRQKRYELGWKSAEILIQRIEGDEENHITERVVFVPELVIRDSA